MAAAHSQSPGLLDLEKELSCSICTDILYQPLTLLDCLHTFCGSCLKEWFGWQAVRRHETSRPDSSSHHAHASPFTCPSCRANVRDTRPNATVTTLLEMFIQANPEKAKDQAEKDELARNYKPGDKVLPELSRPSRRDREHRRADVEVDEEEDRRLMDQVRALSVQEAAESRSTERRRHRRHESNSRGSQQPSSRDGRSTRPTVPSARSNVESHESTSAERRPQARGQLTIQQNGVQEIPPRQVTHQSSLRQILSVSDFHSQQTEEEIMRQILEEGLLEGINLDGSMDGSQEEEISERIAEAIRRMRTQTSAQSPQRSTPRSESAGSNAVPLSTDRPRQTRPETSSRVASGDTRPPASRPHMIEATQHHPRSQSRSSSQSNSRTLRPDMGRSSTNAASRSATDLSERPQTREAREIRTRMARPGRRSTDPSPNRISDMWRRGAAGVSPQVRDVSSRARGPATDIVDTRTSNAREQTRESTGETANGSTADSLSRPAAFAEPVISCDSCGKSHIEYDLHYVCPKCISSDHPHTICSRCYLLGKGCRHWFGFGHAARAKYERYAPPGGYPAGHEQPHVLRGEIYLKPNAGGLENSSGNIPADPAKRLQTGVFCASCEQNANSCYWRCDSCNDGEWGFCNRCVNQARHCTHPLLPQAYSAGQADSSRPAQDAGMVLTSLPTMTTCNICTLPIPPSHTRFHCPCCNDGDYDVCSSCYHQLVSSGSISHKNGAQGWRKCPNGHRMLVVGFEDRQEGRQRIVVHDVVGGWAQKQHQDKDNASPSTSIPPNGGVGARMLALWTRIPDDGVEDELSFPRGAEVREVMDMNQDWYWGIYCRKKGLFPSGYVRAID